MLAITFPLYSGAGRRAASTAAVLLTLLCLLAPVRPARAESFFIRGNVTTTEGINLTDAVYLLNFLFLGGPPPPCRDAADTQDDGQLNLTDSVYLLNFLFLGGPPPPPPYPVCGCDPTDGDFLDCPTFAPCPSPDTVDIRGHVVDLLGIGVPDAAVRLGLGGGQVQATTDINGAFNAEVPFSLFQAGELIVGAGADGYSRNQAAVQIAAGRCVYDPTIVLIPIEGSGAGVVVEDFNLLDGVSAVVLDGTTVRASLFIPPQAFDLDIVSSVRLELLVVDPTTEEAFGFPGGDGRALSEQGQELLSTVGAAEARLTDMITTLPIENLETAAALSLDIPMPVEPQFNCDDTLTMWMYDEEEASYVDCGDAVVRCEGPDKSLGMSPVHFSSYNAGERLPPACLKARFLRQLPGGGVEPLTDIEPTAEGVTYPGISRGRLLAAEGPDAGTYCFTVKQSLAVEREQVRFRLPLPTPSAAAADIDTVYVKGADAAGPATLVEDRALATSFDTPLQPGNCLDGVDPGSCDHLGDIEVIVNRPPLVFITANKLRTCPSPSGGARAEVQLTAEASDPDGDLPLLFLWEAPDGGTIGSSPEAPEQPTIDWRPPSAPGTYRLVVSVTDARKITTVREQAIEVTSGCCPELRRVRASRVGGSGDAFEVDPRVDPQLLLGATASGPDPVTFRWFGPGLNGVTGNPVLWDVQGAGTQTFRVEVSSAVCTVEGTTSVVVLNRPPLILDFTADHMVPCLGTLPLNVAASDPDGDALHYRWSASGGAIQDVDQPMTSWAAPPSMSHRLTVEVRDQFGALSSRTVTVAVANEPPVIQLVMPPSGTVVAPETTLVLEALAFDPDPGGSVADFEWSTSGGNILPMGSQAALQVFGPGAYTVTVTVTDNCGARTSVPIRLTAAREIPRPGVQPCSIAVDIVSLAANPMLVTFISAVAGIEGGEPVLVYDFGDGTPPLATLDTVVDHLYTASQNYQVIVRALDHDGECMVSKNADFDLTADPPFLEFPLCEAPKPQQERNFIRGDADGNGAINITDSVRIFNWLRAGPEGGLPRPVPCIIEPCAPANLPTRGPEPVCLDAADANDDGCIDCMDGTYIAETLFMGCPQFPPPGNMCGPDPTPDFLGCNESPCP